MKDLSIRKENAINLANKLLLPVNEGGNRYITDEHSEMNGEFIVVNVKLNLRLNLPDPMFNQRLKERMEYTLKDAINNIDRSKSNHKEVENMLIEKWDRLYDFYIHQERMKFIEIIYTQQGEMFDKIRSINKYGFVGRNNGYFAIDEINYLLEMLLNVQCDFNRINTLNNLEVPYNLRKFDDAETNPEKYISLLEEEIDYLLFFINIVQERFENVNFVQFINHITDLYYDREIK